MLAQRKFQDFTEQDWRAHEAEERHRDRIAGRYLASAIRYEDADGVLHGLRLLDFCEGHIWRRAMMAVAASPCRSDEFRQFLLQLWLQSGDHLRISISDDRLLAKALRAMLPAYAGPGLTLYRGDSSWNRRNRTYGLSWTSDIEVARGFALGLWRSSQGGSVLLKAKAPAEAIIHAPAVSDNSYGEHEYIVERRLIQRVEVVERFSQSAP